MYSYISLPPHLYPSKGTSLAVCILLYGIACCCCTAVAELGSAPLLSWACSSALYSSKALTASPDCARWSGVLP